MSTIFALATTPGRSAIAVVRVSGPKTLVTIERLTGNTPAPRRASLRTLRDPASGDVLDRALVLWFPAPQSFTGEDQAELHLHGGPAIISAVLTALADLGLELATPGAFTRRAFEHGKVDLVQAEAVADLVDAQTDAQRRQALAQLQGAHMAAPERWRARLVNALSLTEAAIDFADEALPADLLDSARGELRQLKQELLAAISDLRGELVRDGFRIAVIGQPNAGKSSLLNAIVARDASIVTEMPGTTRDIIEVPLVVDGYHVLIADTAGLRPPGDEIEAEGIRRARAWAQTADLRLYVVDQSLTSLDTDWLNCVRSGDMLVLNKQDLPIGLGGMEALTWAASREIRVERCRAAERLVGDVTKALSAIVVERLVGSEPPVVTRTRHRELLVSAVDHIDRALTTGLDIELFAESARLATRCLEQITGRVDTEQVLDQIFGAFCLGK